MPELLYISGTLAALAVVALCVYLIVFIKGVRGLVDQSTQTVQQFGTEVHEMRVGMMNTMGNLEVISEKLGTTLDRVNTRLDDIDDIVVGVGKITQETAQAIDDATDVIHAGRNVVVSLLNLEQNIQSSIEEPLLEALSIFSAIGKGIRKFKMKLAGGGGNHSPQNGASHSALSENGDDYFDSAGADESYQYRE